MTTRDSNPVGSKTAEEALSRIREELETYERAKHAESGQTHPVGVASGQVVPQSGVTGKDTFGQRLRHARGSMSQKELADALGTHVNSVSRYERDERVMDTETLARTCQVLSCDPRWLIFGEGSPPVNDTAPSPPAHGG